jgi:GT2 family glycosyltransferase/glycosyltransferase involved in cell wall biosynthesis
MLAVKEQLVELRSAGVVQFNPPRDPVVSVIIVATGAAPDLLGCLRALAANTKDVPFEVIVVENGVEPSTSDDLAFGVSGVTIVRSGVNRGFAGGSNLGARHARGVYLVLLNDDAEPQPGWLAPLVEAAEVPGVGAVGGRVLLSDGTLQEAGSIIWKDGSSYGVGRDLPGDAVSLRFRRRVEYCSALSFLVRRDLWEELGGLDEGYFPAYYEDVDFCLRIAEHGSAVLYEPRSVVRHYESRSSTQRYKEFLCITHRLKLIERWPNVFEGPSHAEPIDGDSVEEAIHLAMGSPPRVLLIDDRLPDPRLGSGYSRMFDVVREISAAGYRVSVLPTAGAESDPDLLGTLGVGVVTEPLAEHLRRRSARYEVVIISRPHNFARYGWMVRELQPDAHLCYDAEALFHRRLEAQAELAGPGAVREALCNAADEARTVEAEIACSVDTIVCVSADEAAALRALGAREPSVVEPWLGELTLTPAGFAERSDVFLVAGWLAGPESPNVDGLLWFVREVLPIVRARVPWARVRVSGPAPPKVALDVGGRGISFEGQISDMAEFYGRTRACIVPLRYGAGVKIKTVEALQYGVPTVATSVGAEGIDLRGTEALLVADDARDFGLGLISLLTDRVAWERRRAAIEALDALRRSETSRVTWGSILAEVVGDRVATESRYEQRAGI